MANGLSQTAEIVKDGLSRRTEFIVVCCAKMAAKQHREIGVRLKTGHDGRSSRMQDSKHLSETMKRRGSKRERKMAENTVD
jgi:hypothetical protein